MHCGSRFDTAAASDLVAVLRDTDPINAFLNGTFESFLSAIPSCGKLAKEPEKWWSTLSGPDRDKLSVQHSSFPFLFRAIDSELVDAEKTLLEDCPVAEFLRDVQISLPDKLKLFAFAHCLGSANVAGLVGKSEPESKLVDFLSNYSSGVRLAQNKGHTVRELLLLPQLVRSIVDPEVPVDARITTHGSSLLGKMFGPRTMTLKDYERVYVVVFGGVSFLELREIRRVCANGNPRIAVRVISDTICSDGAFPDFSV
jgi:hypothetical protein